MIDLPKIEDIVDLETGQSKTVSFNKKELAVDLVSADDPILREELPRFDFNNPPTDPIEFAHILAQSMLKHGGIGLAANQIGFRHRAFVMMGNPILCCYNPRVVDIPENEDILQEEGCLTFPNLLIKVKRKAAIKVQYTEPNGNVQNRVFANLSSRIFQHELDHLNGILYMDRASSYHYEQAKKNRFKYERGIL